PLSWKQAIDPARDQRLQPGRSDVPQASDDLTEGPLRAHARLQRRLADEREARTGRRVDGRAGRIRRRVPPADTVAEDRIDGTGERRIAPVPGDRLRCRVAQAEGALARSRKLEAMIGPPAGGVRGLACVETV